MIGQVPPEYTVPTRNELVESHKKFRRMKNPDIDTSEGTEPDIDARVNADMLLPVLAHAKKVAECAVVSTSYGDAIATWGEEYNVEKSPPTGSVGYVRIGASNGGGIIKEGDTLYPKNRGVGPRYECALTRHYYSNRSVPIRAIDTGFETNLAPGTVLVWTNPAPGIRPECTVVVQNDDQGLTGGHPEATPEEHLLAIQDKLRNPAGAGNAAHYREEAKRAGVAMEQAFTYSSIKGPGVIALTFTVPPDRRAGTRVPTEDLLRVVGQRLELSMGDDGLLMTTIIEEPTTISYRVTWQSGWADTDPWPLYAADGEGALVIDTSTDALNFSIRTDDNDYTDEEAPSVGNTIALYDTSRGRFAHKRIKTVTGTGPWTIEVQSANAASDDTYVPVVGQRVSPYSDRLDDLATQVIEVFDSLGPGEMFVYPRPDGLRRFREPRPPMEWPSKLTQELLENKMTASNVPGLFDREVVQGDGVAPTVGVPGVTVYMLTLGDLGIYPKV